MFFYIINITESDGKFCSETYMFGDFCASDSFVNGQIGLETGTNMSEKYPELYPRMESGDQNKLINESADNIIEQRGGIAAFVGVSFNGKYSLKRTVSIKNEKVVIL